MGSPSPVCIRCAVGLAPDLGSVLVPLCALSMELGADSPLLRLSSTFSSRAGVFVVIVAFLVWLGPPSAVLKGNSLLSAHAPILPGGAWGIWGVSRMQSLFSARWALPQTLVFPSLPQIYYLKGGKKRMTVPPRSSSG